MCQQKELQIFHFRYLTPIMNLFTFPYPSIFFFFFDKTAFINSLLSLIMTTWLAFCDAKNVVLSILPSKGFTKPCDHAWPSTNSHNFATTTHDHSRSAIISLPSSNTTHDQPQLCRRHLRAIFMDLSNAVDTLDHLLLTLKLEEIF